MTSATQLQMEETTQAIELLLLSFMSTSSATSWYVGARPVGIKKLMNSRRLVRTRLWAPRSWITMRELGFAYFVAMLLYSPVPA